MKQQNESNDKIPTADSNGTMLLDLFRKYHATKDQETRNTLVSKNLELVFPLAKKYNPPGECLEDIIQVGYIGLIKAVENFDPERGIQFSTYASHCIIGEMRHYIRDKTESIKRPRWLKNLNNKVACFVETHIQKHQHLPSIKEISEALNISEEGVVEILKSKQITSLQYMMNNPQDIDLSLIKSAQYQNFKLPLEDSIVLEQTIEKLKSIEKKIIYLFFYKDLTQSQIAGTLGVSQKKVSRLLKKSLEKLKDMFFQDKIPKNR